MDFGKLISYEIKENAVRFHFEKMDGRVEVITDKILNVFAGFQCEEHRSRAIEGDKAVKTAFEVREDMAAVCGPAVDAAAERREISDTAEPVEKPKVVVISTAAVTVKVYDDFKVDFYKADGTVLCRDYRGTRVPMARVSEEMKALLAAEGHPAAGEETGGIEVVKQMEGEEAFYGLGDKTGFMNKRGYEYVMWNTDDPAPQMDNFKSLYKSIPFFITLRSDAVFGLFFDNSYRSSFDMGKESDAYYWYGVKDGNLDYYLIAGDSMPEVMGGYTYLTGTTPLPQKWTLGYQQCRWSYMSQDEVKGIAKKMRECGIPCDVIHLDIDYMDGYRVFTFHPKHFDQMKEMTEELAKDGFKIVTIIDPGVKLDEGYSIYDTGVEKGYFATTPEGEIYVNAVWPGDAVYPDFGRQEVRDWWASNQQYLLDKGVRGVWNDMNEPASFRGELPQDVVFTDEDRKADHARMHNLYGHNMARATYQGLKERDGRRPFVITRACYAGTQKYSTAWTGDNHSIWAHLQMAIPQLCNLGLSGMSFVGTDVGGFGSDCTKELMCRWVEVSCFSPLFRNHSALGTRYQEPWQFDEETLDIYRRATELRYHLIPYYYDLFFTGEKTGLPIMRPLVLHYEKDAVARSCNNEFLVGENLLVAPVVNQGETKKLVYLPAGEWYDYWTGEKLAGGAYILRDAPLDTCPLYVKAGTVLPVWQKQNYVNEKDNDSVLLLEAFPGEGEWDHFQDNGEDFAYRNGAYNQWHCSLSADGTLKVECVHGGYEKKYERVCVTCGGKTVEAAIENGICVVKL